MRVPKEALPIRCEQDLDVFEKFNVLYLATTYKMKKEDMGSLMLAFRIYAGAYHELVLTGRMKSFDVCGLCEQAGIDDKTIRMARDMALELDVMSGHAKENDKGGFDYAE